MSEVKRINNTTLNVTAEDVQSENEYVVRYEYLNGFYHREEKEFLGFGRVITTVVDKDNDILGKTETIYANRDYYSRGMPQIVNTYGNNFNTPFRKVTYTIDSAPFARNLFEKNEESDGSGSLITVSQSEYRYDENGNVRYLEESAYGSETITADINYWDVNNSLFIRGNPEDIIVRGEVSGLLRYRIGDYCSNGRIKSLIQILGISRSNDDSISEIEWDNYGNLKKIIDPNGAYVKYYYDSTHQYVIEIESGGRDTTPYRSFIEWDYTLGKKISETDENGNTIRYEYDEYGRLEKVWSPYDAYPHGVPAVSYSYHRIENGNWYAVTDNKIYFETDKTETLKTVIMTDSMGRALFTAKQGAKWNGTNNDHGWNVSGFTAYDAKGRSVATGQPEFVNHEEVNDLINYFNSGNIELKNPTIQVYDMLDRVILTTLPAAVGTVRPTQETSYQIRNGIRRTTTTDPLGNISRQEVDGRGNIISVQRLSKDGGDPLTFATYTYNGIGEMLSAIDAKGNPLTMEYDMLGRRTKMTSTDIGTKEWQYDRAGNVIVERDSELTHQGRQIRYLYDGMNRLTEIVYPFSENTRYEYGAPNALNNSAGRVTKILDETGSIEYTYGELGQVVTETREIKLLPLSRGQTRTATMRYSSDYLGRMQEIEYPDGETVTYEYNYGGEITSVTGVRQGTIFNYVKNIGYDEFNQRVFIEYGSNVRTTYEYDQYRRWLSSIKTTDRGNNVIQDITYSFNDVGNVLGYTNNAHRHTTTQNYEYDDLYQLVVASGTSVSHPFGGNIEYSTSYRQDFVFDNIGNMQSKVSHSEVSNGARIGDNLSYDLSYNYYNGTHKAEQIGNRFYTYDQNGNLIAEREGGHATNTENYRPYYNDGDIYWTEYGFGVVRPELATPQDGAYQRNYKWNERNLLSESSDSAYTVQYRYGTDGQRAIKYVLNTGRSTLYYNKMWQVNDSRDAAVQSKHIYVGETRIVTKNSSENNPNTLAEMQRMYYYHSDHLGSAQTVTNYQGNVHERLEYTPYGELWIDWKNSTDGDVTPFRFTGKELDEETGLYYYGARYLDPRTSRWLTGDPAIYQGDYFPVAPVNDDARKHNQNLPNGGIYNYINLHAYRYGANNPIKYSDPTGRNDLDELIEFAAEIKRTGTVDEINLYTEASRDGCFARAHLIAHALKDRGYDVRFAHTERPKNPRHNPDDPNSRSRFNFHVAAYVTLDGVDYVIDPFYSGVNGSGITTLAEWNSIQEPVHHFTRSMDYDMMIPRFARDNRNPNINIHEYTAGWLRYYAETRRTNYNGFN